MAGKFYTLDEVSSKLNKSEAEIKELVREGRLREFRDGAKLFFKVDEVDKLTEEFGKVDLSAATEISKADAAASSEISLLLDESGEIGLDKGKDKGKDTDEIGLKLSDDDLSLDKLGEIAKADTKMGSAGINILAETDEGYKLAEDTKGETVAEEESAKVSGGLDDDINMESVGSGSGLLDLSLQADDTSLGAVLDDILPTSKESEAAGRGGEESAQADRIFEKSSEDESRQAAEPVAMAASTVPMGPVGTMMQYAPEPIPTGADNVCSIVLFIPLGAMIVIGMIMLAAFRGIVPGLLKTAGKTAVMDLPLAWVVAIALTVVMLLMVAVAGMSGRPKKEKKAAAPVSAPAKKKKGK
jgi:hypothetical protein